MVKKYKPINGWTRRRILNKLKKHIGSKPCLGLLGLCAYRGGASESTACAVGVFIPDSVYDVDMDGTGDVYELLEEFSTLRSCMPLEPDALSKLQQVHDYTRGTDSNTIEKLKQWVLANVAVKGD